MDGLSITCKSCNTVFYICKSCYRGHKYCSIKCRNHGYKYNNRKTQAKYQKTFKGKQKHSIRQLRYRNKIKSKIVTHHTSVKLKFRLKSSSTKDGTCKECFRSISRIFFNHHHIKLTRSYNEKT